MLDSGLYTLLNNVEYSLGLLGRFMRKIKVVALGIIFLVAVFLPQMISAETNIPTIIKSYTLKPGETSTQTFAIPSGYQGNFQITGDHLFLIDAGSGYSNTGGWFSGTLKPSGILSISNEFGSSTLNVSVTVDFTLLPSVVQTTQAPLNTPSSSSGSGFIVFLIVVAGVVITGIALGVRQVASKRHNKMP